MPLREDVSIRYLGFEIENRFVVGFGLDYEEQGRNLDGVYVLSAEGALKGAKAQRHKGPKAQSFFRDE